MEIFERPARLSHVTRTVAPRRTATPGLEVRVGATTPAGRVAGIDVRVRVRVGVGVLVRVRVALRTGVERRVLRSLGVGVAVGVAVGEALEPSRTSVK